MNINIYYEQETLAEILADYCDSGVLDGHFEGELGYDD